MKKKLFLLSIFLIVFSYSCDNLKDNCEDIACFTPGEIFYFEFLDSETKENLFTNGTYNTDDITVINSTDTNKEVSFSLITENNLNQIQLDATWGTEIITYTFKIDETTLFNFYIDAESVNEHCCSFTRYNEIKVEDIEYNTNEQTGVYEILID